MDDSLTSVTDGRNRPPSGRPSLSSVCVGTAIALLAVPNVAAAAPASRAGPDVTVLFGRAVNMVRAAKRPTYSRAVMFEADGITRGGRCTSMGCFGGRGATTAAGVVSWRFVLDNEASHSRFKSASISYGPPPKAFGSVTGYRASFTEDFQMSRPPRMTLSQAVGLLRRAGHRGLFFNVTLRNPVQPKRSNPLYIFGFAHNRYVSVDTVTKKVKPFA